MVGQTLRKNNTTMWVGWGGWWWWEGGREVANCVLIHFMGHSFSVAQGMGAKKQT